MNDVYITDEVLDKRMTEAKENVYAAYAPMLDELTQIRNRKVLTTREHKELTDVVKDARRRAMLTKFVEIYFPPVPQPQPEPEIAVPQSGLIVP